MDLELFTVPNVEKEILFDIYSFGQLGQLKKAIM